MRNETLYATKLITKAVVVTLIFGFSIFYTGLKVMEIGDKLFAICWGAISTLGVWGYLNLFAKRGKDES